MTVTSAAMIMCIIVDHDILSQRMARIQTFPDKHVRKKNYRGVWRPAILGRNGKEKCQSTLKLEMQYHRSSAKLLGNKSLLSLPMDTQRVELVKPLLIRHQSGVIGKCDITSGNTTKRNPLSLHSRASL